MAGSSWVRARTCLKGRAPRTVSHVVATECSDELGLSRTGQNRLRVVEHIPALIALSQLALNLVQFMLEERRRKRRSVTHPS